MQYKIYALALPFDLRCESGTYIYIVECITFQHLNTNRIRKVSASSIGAVVGMSGGRLRYSDSMLGCIRFVFPYTLVFVACVFKKKL